MSLSISYTSQIYFTIFMIIHLHTIRNYFIVCSVDNKAR
nr:MAG TPA: hypothetical protein [Caudoviricetes sp.]